LADASPDQLPSMTLIFPSRAPGSFIRSGPAAAGVRATRGAAADYGRAVDERIILKGFDHEKGIVTRRVMLLARMGSPTCRLHTGKPWLSPSSRSLAAHDRPAGWAGKYPPAGFHLVIDIDEVGEPPSSGRASPSLFKDCGIHPGRHG